MRGAREMGCCPTTCWLTGSKNMQVSLRSCVSSRPKNTRRPCAGLLTTDCQDSYAFIDEFATAYKRRPMSPVATLRLTMVRSVDDEAPFSPNYQSELRQFSQLVRADNVRINAVASTMDGVGAIGGLVGEFVIPLAQVIGPVLGVTAVAWLQGRAGRKLRLKAGDIEVEARTPEEIGQLLERAKALRATHKA